MILRDYITKIIFLPIQLEGYDIWTNYFQMKGDKIKTSKIHIEKMENGEKNKKKC